MSQLTLDIMAEKALDKNNAPTMFETGGKPVLNCPFCDGDFITVSEWKPHDEYIEIFCRCCDCGATGPVREERRFAIQLWQKRGSRFI